MKRLLVASAAVAAVVLASISPARGAGTPACTAWSAPSTDQYVGSVSVDSTSMAGSSFSLPASGQYRLVSCGVWNNTSHGYVDTAYNSGDAWNWNAPQQGWTGIGPNWGELYVNGASPDWGAYNAGHTYATALTGSGTLGLVIWDGGPTAQNSGWYGDNSGSLTVDVYRINPLPTNGDQCKKDGWKQYGVFKNQGDCVSFVATGGRNLPAYDGGH
ncbi:MAG TPA: hypothetical protein VFJ77_01525 [Gaiellaceae bacterium]|nr:hypothetical protein [Gaiellaceae bacterium]